MNIILLSFLLFFLLPYSTQLLWRYSNTPKTALFIVSSKMLSDKSLEKISYSKLKNLKQQKSYTEKNHMKFSVKCHDKFQNIT